MSKFLDETGNLVFIDAEMQNPNQKFDVVECHKSLLTSDIFIDVILTMHNIHVARGCV
jgi:hypothetical protein